MQVLKINVGVHTAKKFDFNNIDFTGVNKVIFTVKNGTDDSFPVIIRREIFEKDLVNGRYNCIITCEESLNLTPGAVYDFVKEVETGECFKMGRGNGRVELEYGVGRCTNVTTQ